ncbi:MAG: phage holin family protein [Candidatus Shapirobacteria bacterium]
MKKILKYTLYLSFALIIENQIWHNLTFQPEIETIVKVALILAIFELILKPIVKILLLPITFLTLGLFRIIINTLGLYLATFLISGFNVNSIQLFNYSLTNFLAYLFTSFIISSLLYIFKKL